MQHPVRFGADAALFGVYHPSVVAAQAPRAGVVLCNPLGLDEQLSGRVFLYLAQKLAAQGFSVLRFDYRGAGDSLGSSPYVDPIGAWQESIQSAVQWLSDETGLSDLTVVGAQLGATLAYVALTNLEADSSLRGRVTSMVLWSGCVNGREFTRKVRAHQLTQSSVTSGLPKGVLQSGGLWLQPQDVSAVSDLSVEQAGLTPAPTVLVVGSEREAHRSKLWNALYPRVPELHYLGDPNLACFTRDWFQPAVPTAGADAICTWLLGRHPQPSSVVKPVRARAERRLQPCTAAFRRFAETHVTFDGGRLFGVLTEPTDASLASSLARGTARFDKTGVQAPTLLVVSSGFSDRTGPSRCHVELSRTLAERGFRSFRFDVTGMGEAAAAATLSELEPYAPQCQADCAAAVRWLEQNLGARNIYAMGLCSGAYASLQLAMRSKSVSSIVLVNPLWLGSARERPPALLLTVAGGDAPAAESGPSRVGSWALRSEVLARVVAQTVSRARQARASTSRALQGARYRWVEATSGATATEVTLSGLLRAGTRVLLLVGSGDKSREYLHAQIGAQAERLAHHDSFALRLCADADHTFSSLAARQWLADEVVSFLAHARGPAPTTARDVRPGP